MPEPKVGLYLRLSRDDERAGESMSIENQRSFLTQYTERYGWQIVSEYCDDGYSGTNFDRPGFQRMLTDIEAGRINTVITKDLSRLGRDQIYTSYYYQMYFPKKRVRYIAVSEGIDTTEGGASNALLPFLTAANDFYTADISRKVRTALITRKREGKFIGSSPPIGYQKDPNCHGQLIVDPAGADTVRCIFDAYLSIGSVIGVAKHLTESGVPTPSQRKGSTPTQVRSSGVWNDTMVRRILTNPTYAGHLTQHRGEKINYKLDQRRSFPPEQWIVVPNTHEAIVSQEEFKRVQEMLSIRSYRSRTGGATHLLTGLAFCADCGAPMSYTRNKEGRVYMVCQSFRKGGRLHLCSAHSVREDRVIDAIRHELRILAQALDEARLQKDTLAYDRGTSQLEQQIQQTRKTLEQMNMVLDRLYQDHACELITEDEFRSLLERNRDNRTKQEQLLKHQEDKLLQADNTQEVSALVRQMLQFETLDRTTIVALIDRVLIYQDKRIEIQFRFTSPD